MGQEQNTAAPSGGSWGYIRICLVGPEPRVKEICQCAGLGAHLGPARGSLPAVTAAHDQLPLPVKLRCGRFLA